MQEQMTRADPEVGKPRAGKATVRPPPARVWWRRGLLLCLVISLCCSPPFLARSWPESAERILNAVLLALLLPCLLRSRRMFAADLLPARSGFLILGLGAVIGLVRLSAAGHPIGLVNAEILAKASGVILLGFALGRCGRFAGRDSVARSAALLRSTFDSVSEPLLVVADGCRVQEANWYAELRSTEPLIGRLACETVFFRRDDCTDCPVAQSFDEQEPRFLSHADAAQSRRFEISAVPVPAAAGEPRFQVHHIHESTVRHQVQDQESFLRDILARIRDAVIGLDGHDRVTSVNPPGARLLGLDPDQAIERDLKQVIRPEDSEQGERFRRLLSGRSAAAEELTFRTLDGRTVRALAEIEPVTSREGRSLGRALILRDVTEHRRIEELLVQADKMSSLGVFVAGLAHELNNPLAAIVGEAELLRRNGGEIDTEANRRVNEIHRQADRCASIVQGLLRLARKERCGRLPLSLSELVTETVDLLDRSLAHDNIRLCLRQRQGRDRVLGDPTQLQQVLLNLIANARDSIHGQGQGGSITISVSEQDEQVVVRVEDDGRGLPEGGSDQLFQAFFTTKQEGQGTGLGLSISHGIIAEHDGALVARGRDPRGACFEVRLPLLLERGIEVAGPAGEPTRTRGQVLVVEDEPGIARFLRACLESEGYGVVFADDGRRALEILLESESIERVFCDVGLPGLDGIGLYSRLTERRPGYRGRFVFVTGDSLGSRNLPLEEGNRVLAKPFRTEQIRELVGGSASRLTAAGRRECT